MAEPIKTEAIMAIDLVIDAYKLTNPFEIQQKVEETLDMEIHINQIIDYVNVTEDYEMVSNFISHGLLYSSIHGE